MCLCNCILTALLEFCSLYHYASRAGKQENLGPGEEKHEVPQEVKYL